MSSDSFPGVERRETTPIELRKLSNGARTAVITMMVMLLVNMVALIVYIVKDHETQAQLQGNFEAHVEWSQSFAREVTEMKLDLREVKIRVEYISEDLESHRDTE